MNSNYVLQLGTYFNQLLDVVSSNVYLTILTIAWIALIVYVIYLYIERYKHQEPDKLPTKAVEFYDILTMEEKNIFSKLFVGNPKTLKIPLMSYNYGKTNYSFFEHLPYYLYEYRRDIPISLLEKLYQHAIFLVGDNLYKQNLINEAFIRTAFSMRKENKKYLDFAEKVCRIDIDISVEKMKKRNTYIYSCRKLAVILELTDRIDEAIKLINRCIELGLSDGNVTEYHGRLERLIAMKKKMKQTTLEKTY